MVPFMIDIVVLVISALIMSNALQRITQKSLSMAAAQILHVLAALQLSKPVFQIIYPLHGSQPFH